MTNVVNSSVKRLILIFIILLYGCPGKITKPDEAPIFLNGIPTAETTITKMGETHKVRGIAEDPDGDNFQYKTLKDGVQVNNTNEYTFTIDKKGMTKIQIIAYNALSDTLTKNFSANNQSPIGTSKSITSNEETTTYTPESELGYDPDGDDLDYNVTSTSAGVDAQFKNGQLEITGKQDYFGNASVNYNVSDGEGTDNGTVSVTVNNTPDNPQANAGNDKTGTINEEITLNSSSTHPDSPINNIIEYEWRALNGDVQITDANQASAKLTANTAGSYDVELTTTGDNARYIFDYTHNQSNFSLEPTVLINNIWYMDGATVYINKNALDTSSWFEILKGEITHELFTHGTGFRKHSDDPQDVSNTSVANSDISTNEKNAVEINLKLKTNNYPDNYQPE